MSQRIRMLINNIWDSATAAVTLGTEIASLPITHTQKKGRSNTAVIVPSITDTSVVEFDMPNFSFASAFVMYRHWLSNSAKVRLELYNESNQSGDLVYDSGLIDAVETKTFAEMNWFVDPLVASPFDNWPYRFTNLWFNRVFFKSGRLSIVDENARGNVHEIDRIFMGDVIKPDVNFAYGHEFAWRSDEEQKRSVGGSVFTTEREKWREFSFDLNWITEAERPLFSEAIRQVSTSKDWFISMYPESGGQKEMEYAMSCSFLSIPALNHNFHNNYNAKYSVREV